MSDYKLYWVKLHTDVVVAARNEEEAANKLYFHDIDSTEFEADVFCQITNPTALPAKWTKTSIPYSAKRFYDKTYKTIADILGDAVDVDNSVDVDNAVGMVDTDECFSVETSNECSNGCDDCGCSTDSVDDSANNSVSLGEELLPIITDIMKLSLRSYFDEAVSDRLDKKTFSDYDGLFEAVGEIFTTTIIANIIKESIRESK